MARVDKSVSCHTVMKFKLFTTLSFVVIMSFFCYRCHACIVCLYKKSLEEFSKYFSDNY